MLDQWFRLSAVGKIGVSVVIFVLAPMLATLAGRAEPVVLVQGLAVFAFPALLVAGVISGGRAGVPIGDAVGATLASHTPPWLLALVVLMVGALLRLPVPLLLLAGPVIAIGGMYVMHRRNLRGLNRAVTAPATPTLRGGRANVGGPQEGGHVVAQPSRYEAIRGQQSSQDTAAQMPAPTPTGSSAAPSAEEGAARSRYAHLRDEDSE